MQLRAAVYGRADWPTVSVIMPIRNEAADLEHAVQSILAQEYPLDFDVCLAIGPSNDDTALIAERLTVDHPRVSLVSNPAGVTPAGLNAAIAATDGEVIVRVDGHAALSHGYIRRAVQTMRETGAVNVGGLQAAVGATPFEESVAAAMTSVLGTGGSRFHIDGEPGSVDTVYLGVFDRAAGDQVGWFDERLVRNQDYELNIRLRQAGGTVWFDPELSVSYRPRGSLRALARQYYEYGWWKAEVLRMHPESLKVRQALPAALPVILTGAAIASVKRPAFLGVIVSYVGLITATALRIGPKHWRGITMSTIVMHCTWGGGFLASTSRQIKEWVVARAG